MEEAVQRFYHSDMWAVILTVLFLIIIILFVRIISHAQSSAKDSAAHRSNGKAEASPPQEAAASEPDQPSEPANGATENDPWECVDEHEPWEES